MADSYTLKNGVKVKEHELLVTPSDASLLELLEANIPLKLERYKTGEQVYAAYRIGKIPPDEWTEVEKPVFRKPMVAEPYDAYTREAINWSPYPLILEEIMYNAKEIKLGAACGMGEVILKNNPQESKRFIVGEVLRHLQIGGKVWIKRK